MDELRENILVWSRRARLQRSTALAFFGLACGLGMALLLALASRVFPLLETGPLIAISIALALIGLFAAVVYPWLRNVRTRPVQWARTFDQQFGLKDRVSTALEIANGDLTAGTDAMRNVQRNDANRIVEGVDAKQLLPLRISRRDALVALLFLVALIVALALPNPQQQVLAERERLRETVAQQVQQLEQARETIEQSNLTDEQKQLALQALDDARRALEDPNVTPEEALAAINDAQAQLDALNDQAAQQRADDLQRAGESLAADELTNSLANSLANNNFEQAAEQLRDLSSNSQTGQPLGDEEAQRAANQLDQLARGVQNSDPQLAQQMRDAAQQLREGNTQAAQESLNQAAQSMQQAQQSSNAAQSLENAQARAEAARQAIAQAAQAQSSQSQANQPGQEGQMGENNAQQQGAAGQQAGNQQPGATNASQGQEGQPGSVSSLGGASNQQGQSQHSEDSGSDSSVYAPGRLNADGRQVVLPDTQGQNAPNPSGRASTAPGGNTSVPYQEVYREYSQVADEAMQSGQVPAGMRDYVRDYFSSLDPNQQQQQQQQTP
jgi:hypothetical protein